MDWKTTYQACIKTPDQAVRLVKSGNRVLVTGNCSVPEKLMAALVNYAPELQEVEICHPLAVSSVDYTAPEMDGHLRVNSFFVSSNVRRAIHEGRADFTPVLLSEYPLLYKKGILPVDVAFLHLSPPDENGFLTFGIESGLTISGARSARIIVAEVNEQMPTVQGDTRIHISEIAALVPVDYPLAEISFAESGPDLVTEKIAGNIAERIPDGATLQLGIGAIPDAVCKFLVDKKDLGIHTELFSDGVIDLIEAGVLTGARKTLHPGKHIAGFVLGSKKLYQWVHNNPTVELHPTEYVNDPFVIAKNDRMVAINSAIEIDLTGQVCADSIGTKLYSGVGGQSDFIYGSSLSNGGLPVIALPSTTTLRDGTRVSRIVPTLKPGAGVTLTRNHVHYVATEYGIVDLYGKSIRQRVNALITIAHPEFREELEKQARSMKYILN